MALAGKRNSGELPVIGNGDDEEREGVERETEREESSVLVWECVPLS